MKIMKLSLTVLAVACFCCCWVVNAEKMKVFRKDGSMSITPERVLNTPPTVSKWGGGEIDVEPGEAKESVVRKIRELFYRHYNYKASFFRLADFEGSGSISPYPDHFGLNLIRRGVYFEDPNETTTIFFEPLVSNELATAVRAYFQADTGLPPRFEQKNGIWELATEASSTGSGGLSGSSSSASSVAPSVATEVFGGGSSSSSVPTKPKVRSMPLMPHEVTVLKDLLDSMHHAINEQQRNGRELRIDGGIIMIIARLKAVGYEGSNSDLLDDISNQLKNADIVHNDLDFLGNLFEGRIARMLPGHAHSTK